MKGLFEADRPTAETRQRCVFLDSAGATSVLRSTHGGDVSELVTSTGTGVLVSKDLRVSTRYRLHTRFGGRAVMIEVLDRPDGIARDEHIHVVLDNGRVIACRVLDETLMCAVVGEGLGETAP